MCGELFSNESMVERKNNRLTPACCARDKEVRQRLNFLHDCSLHALPDNERIRLFDVAIEFVKANHARKITFTQNYLDLTHILTIHNVFNFLSKTRGQAIALCSELVDANAACFNNHLETVFTDRNDFFDLWLLTRAILQACPSQWPFER